MEVVIEIMRKFKVMVLIVIKFIEAGWMIMVMSVTMINSIKVEIMSVMELVSSGDDEYDDEEYDDDDDDK